MALAAQVQGGRAEIRLLMGDSEVARLEVQRALATHREVGNVVGEAEDSRVLAGILAALGQHAQAETMLREVISRAMTLHRPLLAAQAERDLARIVRAQRRDHEAAELARSARERFERLGAAAEVQRLDALLTQLAS